MRTAPWGVLPSIEEIGGRESGMARRRMTVLDILEMLVAWDAGEGISPIARRLGYTRATVRKYVAAADALGIPRGGSRRSEAEWTAVTAALTARWGVFYRYVAKHWPDRLQHAPRVTIRRDDPPAGEEAQVDFFYIGLWD